jgi:acyl-CoA synthetase (AMP-forming)/AMP-acid ligase II
VDRVAFYLSKQGMRSGDRIAVHMPNCPEWVALYYGIIRLGAIAVCVGAAYKQREIEHLLNNSQVSLLIICNELLSQVPKRGTIPTVNDVIAWENDSVLASIFETHATENEPFVPPDCNPGDEFLPAAQPVHPRCHADPSQFLVFSLICNTYL